MSTLVLFSSMESTMCHTTFNYGDITSNQHIWWFLLQMSITSRLILIFAELKLLKLLKCIHFSCNLIFYSCFLVTKYNEHKACFTLQPSYRFFLVGIPCSINILLNSGFPNFLRSPCIYLRVPMLIISVSIFNFNYWIRKTNLYDYPC